MLWMPKVHVSPTAGAQPSPQPAPWQKLRTGSTSPRTLLSDARAFLKGKRDWTHHLPVPHFKHRATLRRQRHTSSFLPAPAAVISFFPLPQCLSGKMLPVSFDGNSATQVKSLVLFSSFVVTATSEFNTAACFSAAVFAWQKIKELSTFLPYILLSGVYNLAGKMLTAEDQHSKSQCGGSLSFQLWEGKQYVIFITFNRRLLWGFYFLDFFWYERFSHFKLSNWMY